MRETEKNIIEMRKIEMHVKGERTREENRRHEKERDQS